MRVCDTVFAGLVNLSQMGLMMLVRRCSGTLKHFVLESSMISENVSEGAGDDDDDDDGDDYNNSNNTCSLFVCFHSSSHLSPVLARHVPRLPQP